MRSPSLVALLLATCILHSSTTFAQPPKGQVAYSPVMGSALPGKEFKAEVIPAEGRLVSLQVNVGKWQIFDSVVKGVKLVYEDARGGQQETQVGPCDGRWEKAFALPKGTLLVGISGSYGLVIDSLQFHLSDGTSSPRFGGKGGDLDFQVGVKKEEAKGGKYPLLVRGVWGKASTDSFIGIGLILVGTGVEK